MEGAGTQTLEQLQNSMDRLVTTIKRLESELANYAVDQSTFNGETIVFDVEFLLQLAFVVFEQAAKWTESACNVPLVFEFDTDLTSDHSFEVKLNQLMNDWVLVYLPSMINRIILYGTLTTTIFWYSD